MLVSSTHVQVANADSTPPRRRTRWGDVVAFGSVGGRGRRRAEAGPSRDIEKKIRVWPYWEDQQHGRGSTINGEPTPHHEPAAQFMPSTENAAGQRRPRSLNGGQRNHPGEHEPRSPRRARLHRQRSRSCRSACRRCGYRRQLPRRRRHGVESRCRRRNEWPARRRTAPTPWC